MERSIDGIVTEWKYITKVVRTLLLFVEYLVMKKLSRLSDDRLGVLLRIQVHIIEKGLTEQRNDFIPMILARKLYYEAKRRDLLSHEENEWCERILLGRQIELAASSNVKFDNMFMKTIRNRRSVRSWQNGALKENDFEQLVDSARWAPSGCNRQPWHFLLTRDKDKIKLLSELRGQKFVRNAPNCILVLMDMRAYYREDSRYTPYLDAGAAIQNLLLIAHSKGLGACWVNFGTQEVPKAKRAGAKAAFGIPAYYEIVSIIPVGNPEKIPHPPGRKKISDILSLEVFKETEGVITSNIE